MILAPPRCGVPCRARGGAGGQGEGTRDDGPPLGPARVRGAAALDGCPAQAFQPSWIATIPPVRLR